MKKFEIEVSLNCYYEIEARDEDLACEKAWDYFLECEPEFKVKEVRKNED